MFLTKLKEKRKLQQLGAAAFCGLLFTMGGQGTAYAGDPYLYGTGNKQDTTPDGVAVTQGYVYQAESMLASWQLPAPYLPGAEFTVNSGTWGVVHGGAYEDKATAVSNNKVIISGGTMNAVYGGNGVTASHNTVTINGGTVDTLIRGGNSFYLKDAVPQSSTYNTVKITGGTISGIICGGFSDTLGKAENNNVTISGVTIGKNRYAESWIYGGYSALGSASGNEVKLTNVQVETVYGGAVDTFKEGSEGSKANSNTVTISGGTVTDVYGGYNRNKEQANSNTVTISGGTITNVYGGLSNAAEAAAENNIVTLGDKDGTGVAKITGKVFINAKADIEPKMVEIDYGSYVSSVTRAFVANQTAVNGGTLNVYNCGNQAGNLYAPGAAINFYIKAAEAAGTNTMLTVSDAADISGATINVGTSGSTTETVVREGDTLLKAGTLTTDEKTKLQDNTVGTYVASNYVSKGALQLSTDSNSLKLQNDKTDTSAIYAGVLDGYAATDNTLTLDGSSVPTNGTTYTGAYSSTGDAKGGVVKITGGTYGTVYGGYSDKGGQVSGNTITLSGGEVTNLYGGHSSGTVGSNTIKITGGTVTGTIAGDDKSNKIDTLNYSGGEIYTARILAKNLVATADISLSNKDNKIDTLTAEKQKVTLSGGQYDKADNVKTLVLNNGSSLGTAANIGALIVNTGSSVTGNIQATDVTYNVDLENTAARSITADKLTIGSGAALTSHTNDLSGIGKLTIYDGARFDMSGELNRTIYGVGTTVLQNDLTAASAGGAVEGTLNLNGKTINLQEGDKETAQYSNISAGALSGTGDLRLDVDFQNGKSDTITITGIGSGATVNLRSIIVRTNDDSLALGESKEISYLVKKGDGNLAGITTNFTSYSDPTAEKFAADEKNYAVATTTAKYTFSQGSVIGTLKATKETAVSLKDFISGEGYGKNVYSYTIDNDVNVAEALGELTNKAAKAEDGTTLAINKDKTLAGNGTADGITVGNNSTLRIVGEAAGKGNISSFATALTNRGTLHISNIAFSGNTTDIVNNGTVNAANVSLNSLTGTGTLKVTGGTNTINGNSTQGAVEITGGSLAVNGADTTLTAATVKVNAISVSGNIKATDSFSYQGGDISKAAIDANSLQTDLALKLDADDKVAALTVNNNATIDGAKITTAAANNIVVNSGSVGTIYSPGRTTVNGGEVTSIYAGSSAEDKSSTGGIINIYSTASVANVYLNNKGNKLYLHDLEASSLNIDLEDAEIELFNKKENVTEAYTTEYSLDLSGSITANVETKNVDLAKDTVVAADATVKATKDATINGATISGSVEAGKAAIVTGGTISGSIKAEQSMSLTGTALVGTKEKPVELVSAPAATDFSDKSGTALLDSILSGASIGIEGGSVEGTVRATGIASLGGAVVVANDSTFHAEGALLVQGGDIKGTIEATDVLGITGGNISGTVNVTKDGGKLAIAQTSAVETVVSGTTTVSGKNSTVELSGGLVQGSDGTLAEVNVSGTGSAVTLSGTTVGEYAVVNVSGANSKVELTSGTINGKIIGKGTEGDGTTVNITGGELTSTSEVTANEISLGGAKVNGALNAHTINLNSLGAGSSLKIFLTGSTLNYCTNETALISSFGVKDGATATLNFYIPSTAVNNDVLMEVTSGDVNLEGGTVNAGVRAGSKLKVGDTVTLLYTSDGDIQTDTSTVLNGKLTAGVSVNYELETTMVDDSGTKVDTSAGDAAGKKLVSTITKAGIAEQTKSFVETMAANVAMLNGAADLFAGQGFEQAAVAASLETAGTQAGAAIEAEGSSAASGQAAASAAPSPARSMAPFAAMGGSNLRSHSGSYVDSRGMNFALGMSKRVENSHGSLLFGPMLEYGRGSYASHLDDGTRGDGTTKSWGVGVFARQENHNGSYYEGSLRAGTINADYRSAAMGTYETEAPYVSFHVGAGKKVSLNAKDNVDYYAKYFFTHQNGDDINIHTPGGDEAYSFGSVNSSRIRLGARWNHQLNKRSVIYLGAGWQYELDGEAVATYQGMQTPSPSVKGSSYLYELGWKISTKKDTSLDLNLTGWSGKQEGITFGARFNWGF